MKKLLLSAAILVFSLSAFAQPTTQSPWLRTGNISTLQSASNDFMGYSNTTVQAPLIFKTMGIERMRISPAGDLSVGGIGGITHIGPPFPVPMPIMPPVPGGPPVVEVHGNTSILGNLASNGVLAATDVQTSTLTVKSTGNINSLTVIGNLVIGTTSPTEKLTVQGNARISGNIIADGSLGFGGNKTITYTPATGTSPARFSYGEIDPPPSGPCQLPTLTTIPLNQFPGIIQTWGNNSDNLTNVMSMGFDGANGIIDLAGTRLNGTDPGLLINYYCGKSIYMCTGTNGGNVYMCNSNTGNVGIGTSNPLQKLQVNGSISIYDGNGNTSLFFGAESVPSHAFGKWGIQYVPASVIPATYGGLNFWVPSVSGNTNVGNYALFLQDDGRVGIGTTHIGNSKLAVEGRIAARELKLTVNPFPDYVFEKDYKLLSLEELNKYILLNKHLPEIPSADEVKNNDGIDVGKMQAELLKKIEELTLYVVQQNEKIKQLEGDIKEIKK